MGDVVAAFFFLVACCVVAAVLGPLSVLLRQRESGGTGALMGAAAGGLLSGAIVAGFLGQEEITFAVCSVAVLMAVLAFLSGRIGLGAAARIYARDLPKLSPGRYLGQSLLAWTMLFELPVMLIAGLFRLLQTVGLFH
jgi:hypothetical protein